ncbi:MAG: hypothetical protein FJ137_17395 [Deltaproteobacteria bacterium]|nr:hypothetical protein [Deltaproteobacteria bacterium]
MNQQAMTAFAQAALAVSDLVAAKFSGMKFTGKVPRVVKVQAPQVPSTGGGKQARESVVLIPESGDTAHALTAGFIDVGLRAIELRTYAAVAAAYQQRHGTVLDLPKPEYETFAKELQAFLGGEGYAIKSVDVSDVEAKAAKARAGGSDETGPNKTLVLVGGLAAVVVGGVVLLLLLR